jgi:crotonobetainyl-CoA:carnitine CoA-transferase CaiB-like acyl-CoA transferase
MLGRTRRGGVAVSGVLEELRVLDLARGLAGSLAGVYLSDQGAEVIKVEPPGGDPTRALSASHVWNRGKKSVILDLKDVDGKGQFEQLAATADVLLESFRPGTMDRLGLGYETLAAINPRLIYCSITGYGRRGPSRDRPAYDALVQARLGMHFEQPSYRKHPDGSYVDGPVFLYVPLPSYGAMLLAGTGIAAALHAREVTGAGQWVETSLAQGALMWASQIRYRAEHEPANFATVPYHGRGTVYECADGNWVHLMTVRNSDQVLYDLLDVAPEGRNQPGERLSVDERNRRRVYLETAFRRLPRDQALALLQPAGVPVVPVQPAWDAYSTPQLVHNGMVVEVDDPDEGPIRMIGIPYWLEKTPSSVQGPAPRPGQDTDEVLAGLGAMR